MCGISLKRVDKNIMEIGDKFNNWIVLSKQYRGKVKCVCICGNICNVNKLNLTHNKSKGCLECLAKSRTIHGMSNSKTYSIWSQMRERCHTETHPSYKHYGARGIKVCDRWIEKFSNFLEDMGEKPEGLSIDRIDNDKGYCKENCKWSNKKEQNKNKQNSIHIGDIYCDWLVKIKLEEPKKFLIECIHCKLSHIVWSCNVRIKRPCKCKEEKL